MRLIPNVSIKRKQMLIIMMTSSVALWLACVAFVTYELLTFRQDMKRNLLGLAQRISEKSIEYLKAAPAMDLNDANDPKTLATTNLNWMLQPEPNIISACLYDKNGKFFTKYRRSDQVGHYFPPPAPASIHFEFYMGRLTLGFPILYKNEAVGGIQIESDLDVMYERLVRYAGIVVGVLLVSLLVAFVLSSRLQRVISEPIIHLSQVAKIVSNKKNYAIRAVKYSDADHSSDELNSLIDGFNEMLGQIQERDGQLQKANDELEKRVEGRTRDLVMEIAERTRAEKALQQQFARISLLNQITHSISERQDLTSVLMIILKQLEDHLPVDFGAVFVADSPSVFVLTAVRSVKKLPAEAALRLCPNSVMTAKQAGLQECVQKQTLSIPDTTDLSAPLMHLLSRVELKSVVAVPLLVEDQLFGVLLVARRNANSFSSGECEFLRMLSEQAALAAHQARLHSELQEAYNELRQTQQAVMQQQRLRALGQMASGIAHDINNALSPIIVYSELVTRNERSLTENSKRHLVNIKTAGEDIAHIVARMREFYRRREETDELVGIDLNKLVEQVVELTRPRWKDIPQQKGMVVEMETELNGLAPEIQGNASELREALTNLILNSVDAMPSGGTLTIRTWLRSSTNDKKLPPHVILEVCDTGVGMDEETRNRCLEPFFSTKGQRGTGLGLAMVYGIMERHEGSIEIESAVGKGTTMRLIFPIGESTEFDTETIQKAAKVSPLRILCIDDEPLLRQLMKEILESDGHAVAVADGGQAGLQAFRTARSNRQGFDVVITDLGMPYCDGRQVASVLKKESPTTPVILLTGWGTMMKADGEVPAQVDAIVSKPPRINELRETLLKLTQKNSGA